MIITVGWSFGVVFILVGIWGFVNAPILGLFEVNALHNTIHVLSGIVALAATAGGARYAKLYFQVFGVVYALVTVLGFGVPGGNILGVLPLNLYDNLLHLVIAALALYLGFAGK